MFWILGKSKNLSQRYVVIVVKISRGFVEIYINPKNVIFQDSGPICKIKNAAENNWFGIKN